MLIIKRYSLLPGLKTKPPSHFNQKILQVGDDTFFQIGFTVRRLFLQPQELQQISITKYIFRFHIILDYMFFEGSFLIGTKSGSFIQKTFNPNFAVE